MPPEESDTSPQTLKPNTDTPSLLDDVGVSSLSPRDYVRSQEDLYNNYLAELRRSGKDFTIDTKTGTVKIKPSSGGSSAEAEEYIKSRGITDPLAIKTIRDEFAGEDSDYVVDPIGSQYLSSLSAAELAMDREAEDAKERKALLGSVRSFYDTEQDKTAEITRQFKDFDNRASLLYDLMEDEQMYGMRADDQNIQNMAAQQDLGMAVIPGGLYGKPSLGSSLSSILRPSLANYVRPDYRLNQAVGLPGAQGFDDPDYGPDGMPMFAMGTDPNKPRRVWPWPPRSN